MEQRFGVILNATSLPPWLDIAKPFAQFHKKLVPDVLPILKMCSGLLAENINRVDADALSQCLNQAGLSNIIVPSERIAATMTPHGLTSVQLTDKGLSVSAHGNSWLTIPWAAFDLLAAAVFKETQVHVTKTEQGPSIQEKLVKAGILLTTGLPLPMSKKKTIQTSTTDTNLHTYLDLFLEKPEMRLRLDGLKLDYHFLGDKMGMGAQENFRTFLRELAPRLPTLHINATYATFLAASSQPVIYQESEKIFDQECRWLLTQRRLFKE